VALKPEQVKRLTFKITVNDLKFYNSKLEYNYEGLVILNFIGTNSRDVKHALNW